MYYTKSNLLSVLVLLIILFIKCEKDDSDDDPVDLNAINLSIQEKTQTIYEDLKAIHEDFHQYPELAGEEKRTSGKIAKYLTDLGLEVKTNIGGYGVIGILKSKKPGKTIAWRADIDALPNNDAYFIDPVDYASKVKGVRHTCGHDVNTTIALGIANVLSGVKDKLKGNVVFVFQPAEETGEGALAMIKDGFYNITQPDEIYASHVWPFSVGEITTKSEELYGYNNILTLKFDKKVYASNPKEFAKNLLNNLSNVGDDFWDDNKIGDAQIGVWGNATIYKNYITWSEETFKMFEDGTDIVLEACLVFGNRDGKDAIPNQIRELIKDTEFEGSLNSIHITESFGVNNDPNLTSESINTIRSINGLESVIPQYGQMPGFNDDFAYFQEKTPGVYFLLGASDFEKGIISVPHAPIFTVDQKCIKVGVSTYSSLIVDRLYR